VAQPFTVKEQGNVMDCFIFDGNEFGQSCCFINDRQGVDFFYGRFAWNVGGVEADIPWTDEVNIDFLPRL